MSDLLEADSILKEFGDNRVLTDIALRCQPGDIIGLLGRNGSGKSTLMKILFGTLSADHKFIRINNTILNRPFKTKKTIAYLNQDNFLPKDISIKQVFKIYSDRLDQKGFLDDEIFSKISDTKIGNLSGGELRYLEVKLLLYFDSPFLLLDEPFNGISPLHVEIIKKMILEKSVKKGIVLTDHDYRNVLDIANKYYLLFDGGLKHVKSIQDLVDWGYVPEKQPL
jgi:ABC-type lipopolysaccharide export system ATPase subunit